VIKRPEDKFKEAAEAYEVLSNPEKKSRYDQFGHNGVGGAAGFGGGQSMNMEDIFSQFGDIFGGGNPFESFFGGGGGGGRGGRRTVNRGTNLRIKVKLTLEEIAKGAEKKIKVNKQISCPDLWWFRSSGGCRSIFLPAICVKEAGKSVVWTK
jgi:molecular chaperone DnaJ